jgi:hypothetical protein
LVVTGHSAGLVRVDPIEVFDDREELEVPRERPDFGLACHPDRPDRATAFPFGDVNDDLHASHDDERGAEGP